MTIQALRERIGSTGEWPAPASAVLAQLTPGTCTGTGADPAGSVLNDGVDA